MRHFNKLIVLLIAGIMAFTLTAVAGEPASEQTAEAPVTLPAGEVKVFVTPDSVLSIEAPADNDKWAVIPDDKKLLAISDGTDTITVEHYANGEELPEVALAKDDLVQIYQVYFSTKNEVFIVTGEVTVAAEMPYIRQAVNSFKVLKYDTKQAKQDDTDTQPQAEYDIRKIESDMYCTATEVVNVRASYSTDSDRIGFVSFQEKVYVIGQVTKDGQDTGWLQIQYGDGVGYVYETWFDSTRPEDPQRTGDQLTLYREDGASTKTIYYYTDNHWRDDNGQIYYQIENHKYILKKIFPKKCINQIGL